MCVSARVRVYKRLHHDADEDVAANNPTDSLLGKCSIQGISLLQGQERSVRIYLHFSFSVYTMPRFLEYYFDGRNLSLEELALYVKPMAALEKGKITIVRCFLSWCQEH